MFAMIGCSKNEDDKGNNPDTSITPEATNDENEEDVVDNEKNADNIVAPEMVENTVVKEEYDFNDYIKLGKYKGVEVKVEQVEVTDEDVDVAIQMNLNKNGATPIDVTDRTVKMGDTLNIDFAGYHKGELFEGGSAEGHVITVGSKTFIDGFEEQLVGAELNKEIEVNVVFPENYGNATLAGEPAVFKVIVNGIQHFELSEDYLKNTLGFDTEEAYKEDVRGMLSEENVALMKNKKENDIYNAVIDGSEITLPDNLLEYHASELRVIYTNLSAQYGMDLETFVSMSGYSMDALENDIEAYANNMATRELIIKAISTAEGIEVSEDEIDAEVEEYIAQYGYESKDEFKKTANMDIITEDLLFEKIIDLLVSESVEV